MAQRWIWDGGRPCIDLVNTLRDRRTAPRECLLGPADLAEWLTLAGLAPPTVDVAPEHLSDARELREAVDRLVLTGDRRMRPADIEALNHFARAGYAPPQLVPNQRGGLEIRHGPGMDPIAIALSTIATDAINLLTTSGQGQVRECAASGCGLRFQDHSPSANRQWCSMKRCGNREKAKKHYSRRTRSG